MEVLSITASIAGSFILILALIYLSIGLFFSIASVFSSIIMMVSDPDEFKKWESEKPFKGIHYIPQLVIFGLFLWPSAVFSSVNKKRGK